MDFIRIRIAAAERPNTRRRTAALLVLAVAVASSAAQTAAPSSGNDPKVAAAISEIGTYAAKAGENQEAVEDVFMRAQFAIHRLARAGVPAVAPMEAVLADPNSDWKLKAMMCEALGRINDAGSASALAKVANDAGQHEFVRAAAGHALAAMGRSDFDAVVEDIVSNPAVPASVRARTMMAAGATGFDDVDWLKRAAEGDGLGLPDDPAAKISQELGGIMLNAQRALGASRNPKALDAIIELQGKYPTNGIYTEILARKKDPRSIPVLLKVLTYKNPNGFTSDAMMLAADALGAMRAEVAVAPLIDVVKNDPNELFVGRAALALAAIGDARAIDPIQNVVDHLRTDSRFKPAIFEQERAGWGTAFELKKSLSKLKSK
ncbi:MAG: HEAT repeat domain-containing protein [Elusimicrobia bacterium]|nr:HEAT repeat domain-containing protein [Elusimicrobiota bacterium]